MLGMGYSGLNVSHNSQNTRKTRDYKKQNAGILQNAGETMAELSAGAIIDRMHIAAGVSTDIALSAYCGLGKSTAGGWRNRNTVPFEECVKLAQRKGVSLDWLLLGLGTLTGADADYRVHDGDAADPRLQRMTAFLAHWAATRSADDQAWLEGQLARSIPEYAEWVATRKS
jgi:hypothetical protein